MKVLAPLDGSQVSLDALEKGMTLLASGKPDVTLLCVRPKGFDEVDETKKELFEDNPDDEIFASEEEAQSMLDAAAVRCKKAGVSVATKVVIGSIPDTVLEEAQDYDLLLMHRLTKETFKEKMRMSNLEGMVRNAPCSVMLV